MAKRFLVSLSLFALSACVSAPSALSVRDLAVSPPSLMVAKKSKRPLFIVLDESRVGAELPVLVGGEDRGGRLADGQLFVTRDVVKALSAYFTDVTVVRPDELPDAGAFAVADVKIDRVEVVVMKDEKLGGPASVVTVSTGAAVLTWALAIRLSESDDYLYSFAGETPGLPGKDPNFVFRSMFEQSLSAFLKSYSDKEVHKHVLESEPAASAQEKVIGI